MSTKEAQFADFEGLGVEYDARVLAPRAWTAAQSRWAAELIRTAPTGSVHLAPRTTEISQRHRGPGEVDIHRSTVTFRGCRHSQVRAGGACWCLPSGTQRT